MSGIILSNLRSMTTKQRMVVATLFLFSLVLAFLMIRFV
jgi:hypothetical protein